MRKLVAILSLGTTLGTTLVVSSAAAAVLGPVDTYDALKETIETAQKGDTVKIAAGRIVFPAAIAIDKDLTLEGATDGKTYLWGDPEDDDYWFINGADPGKGKQTKIWNATRGEINDLESVTNAYYRQGSNDYFKNNTTNCLNFVGAATNVILRNLVIADFMQGAVSLQEGATGVVENCQFYANGSGHWQYSVDGYNNYSRAALYGTGVFRVFDSAFVGNNHGLFCNGTSAGVTNVICNCRFVSNTGDYGGSALRSAAPATFVSNCVFKLGYSAPTSGYDTKASSALTIASASAFADIYGCDFLTNTVSGYSIAAVTLAKSGNYRFTRCSFVGNSTRVEELYQSHWSAPHATCIAMQESTLVVCDSLFRNNEMVLKGTKNGTNGYPGASVLGVCKGSTLFVNCTISGNKAENHYDDEALGKCNLMGTFAHAGSYYGSGAIQFVNAVIEGSSFLGYHTAEFVLTVMNKNHAGELSCPTFLNSIVLNDDPNYKPFLDTWTNGFACVANSYFSRFNDDALVTDANCYRVNLWTAEDLKDGEGIAFTAKDWDNPGCPRLERLAYDSFGVKSGRSVWLVNGKSAYWYDETTKKYRSLSDRKTSSATVAGIDDATSLIPDGYGVARRRNHVALGPLNGQSTGFLLMVQ